MAEDDPRVVVDQVEHPLLCQGADQLVGQVASNLDQGSNDEPLGEGHAHPGYPGVAGKRPDDLAIDVPQALRFDLLRISGEIEREPGLDCVGARRRGALGDPFEPLQGQFLGEGHLLWGQVAEVGRAPLLVGRAEKVAVVG